MLHLRASAAKPLQHGLLFASLQHPRVQHGLPWDYCPTSGPVIQHPRRLQADPPQKWASFQRQFQVKHPPFAEMRATTNESLERERERAWVWTKDDGWFYQTTWNFIIICNRLVWMLSKLSLCTSIIEGITFMIFENLISSTYTDDRVGQRMCAWYFFFNFFFICLKEK